MKELTLLAEEKEFKSKFLSHKPYKYSTNENLRQLFLLVEIQKWLRDAHNVHANAVRYYENFLVAVVKYKNSEEMYLTNRNTWSSEIIDDAPKSFSIYEEALREAVYKGLQMIGGKTNE